MKPHRSRTPGWLGKISIVSGTVLLLGAGYGCSSQDENDSASGGQMNTGGTAPGSGGADTLAVGGAASTGGVDGTGGISTGGVGVGGGDLTGGMGGESPTGGAEGTGGALTALPELLSETGLYEDITKDLIASDVRPFLPQFTLWSDGATKRRWVKLPAGEKIDTTDMDNWTFPVGTQMWKEFSRDGKRIETRILMRVRTGGRGWKGMAYLWNDSQSDAVAVPDGLENASGTAHDIPAEGDCQTCHGERPDWPLGFSAIQLSHPDAGVTLDSLVEEGALTIAPEGPLIVPGTDEEKAVVGYLHANCGQCHREGGAGTERSGFMTWLNVGQLGSIEETDPYSLMVNQPTDSGESTLDFRVYGGSISMSEVYLRMSARDDNNQMPPLGTEDPDTATLALIEEWIDSLPPPDAATGGSGP